ncbi:MAG: transporter substrate-binding domain-containing protein [Pseudomonadota bacterium]
MNTVAQRIRQRGWLSFFKIAVFAALIGFSGGVAPVLAADELPMFRQVAKGDVTTSLRKVRRVRFAVDTQFPPFAFRDTAGALTGFLPLSVDAMCADLKIKCEFVIHDTVNMEGALTANEADVAVYMKGRDELDFEKLEFTRPFLRPFGRFAARTSSPIRKTDVRTLAGKRIGVRAGTTHASFIKQYFNRSLLVTYSNHEALYEAARTGKVDIVFDDAFRLMFWLQGTISRQCCHFVGRGYLDPSRFSKPLSMVVRREDNDLRKVLDYGLDRLQTSGRFALIYNRFFPQSPY